MNPFLKKFTSFFVLITFLFTNLIGPEGVAGEKPLEARGSKLEANTSSFFAFPSSLQPRASSL
ncbi:MAG: hypothetical protein HYS07_08285, partial [Chlamydiae bacterium]|nr:hypothetical protein [Chlamydiota bacterium]MBI3276603.1 hypothetical protein [Chlamydiota bacterium]